MTQPTPPPPPRLGGRGVGFWRQITTAYELGPDEHELLVEACRLLDQCEWLQDTIDRDGLTTLGSSGQPRVHPAVSELRSNRLALGRLLAQLDLPDQTGASHIATPYQARARTAARVRWAKTEHVRELRRHGPPTGT